MKMWWKKLLGLVAVLLIVVSCSEKNVGEITEPSVFEPLASTDLNRLYILGTDFKGSAAVSVIRLNEGIIDSNVVKTHTDAVIRTDAGGENLFIINRMGQDMIDLRTGADLVSQWEVKVGLNPQDLKVVGDSAYVTRSGSNRMLKIDLITHTSKEIKPQVGALSLESLADVNTIQKADGTQEVIKKPEMSQMFVNGDEIHIILQRANLRSTVEDYSSIAVWNTKTDSVDATYQLGLKNPATGFKQDLKGNVYVGSRGSDSFDKNWKFKNVLDGGIEKIDIDTYKAGQVILSEKELGGNIEDFILISDDKGVVSYSYFPTQNLNEAVTELVEFNPRTGKKGRVLARANFYTFNRILIDRDRGMFYVISRDTKSPGVLTFDLLSLEEKTELKFNTTLPPFDLSLGK